MEFNMKIVNFREVIKEKAALCRDKTLKIPKLYLWGRGWGGQLIVDFCFPHGFLESSPHEM
jgi:hypothetical protein